MATRARSVSALAIVAALCGAPACGPTLPPSAPSPLADRGLPDFQSTTMDGRELGARALRGHLAVVTFFGKKCGRCGETLPALQGLSQEQPDVAFVGIAEDDFALDSKDLVTMYRLTFPIVHDKGRSIGGGFHVEEMPATFVADRHGIVRWVGGADQSIDQVRQALEVLR